MILNPQNTAREYKLGRIDDKVAVDLVTVPVGTNV